MKLKAKIDRWLKVALAIFTLVSVIYSAWQDWDVFFRISFPQILTVFVAVGITFYATQRKNDERIIKEHVEKIIEKMQSIVTDCSFFIIREDADAEQVSQRIMMTCRKLSNYIDILRKYQDICAIKAEVEYLSREVSAYDTLVSDNIKDMKYLSKSGNALRRHAENIESKCNSIVARLYLG